MKEKDYMNVSNLVKLRIANHVLCDVFPDDENKELIPAIKLIDRLIKKLEAKVVK